MRYEQEEPEPEVRYKQEEPEVRYEQEEPTEPEVRYKQDEPTESKVGYEQEEPELLDSAMYSEDAQMAASGNCIPLIFSLLTCRLFEKGELELIDGDFLHSCS